MSRVRVRRVAAALGGQPVLRGIDLDVRTGEWLALIGPNGAGKTTLLRAIAGLLRVDGQVLIDADDPAELRPRDLARRVALVPQQPTLPPGMTVTDYVLLGRTPYISYLGVESNDDLDVVAEVLGRLDLEGLGHRELSSLSGGELQRAVLARALAQQAPVLLLDEPTSALDIGHVQQVLELVDGLRHLDGLTVVAAMHDLTTAARYADEVVLLADGVAVASGPPEAVITTETIRTHYGAHVHVIPTDDGPVVVPQRLGRLRRGAGVPALDERA